MYSSSYSANSETMNSVFIDYIKSAPTWNIFQSRPKIEVDLIYGFEGKGGESEIGNLYFCQKPVIRRCSLVKLQYFISLQKGISGGANLHFWKYNRLPVRIDWASSNLSNCSIEVGCPLCIGARQSHKILISDVAIESVLDGTVHRSLISCVQDKLWENAY